MYFDILLFLLTESAVYSQAPSTADLMVYVARKIPTMWYQVGILLDIETTALDSSEKEITDQVRLFMKVFSQWKREQNVPFTWETIITALDTLGERKTAADIREWLTAECIR